MLIRVQWHSRVLPQTIKHTACLQHCGGGVGVMKQAGRSMAKAAMPVLRTPQQALFMLMPVCSRRHPMV